MELRLLSTRLPSRNGLSHQPTCAPRRHTLSAYGLSREQSIQSLWGCALCSALNLTGGCSRLCTLVTTPTSKSATFQLAQKLKTRVMTMLPRQFYIGQFVFPKLSTAELVSRCGSVHQMINWMLRWNFSTHQTHCQGVTMSLFAK